MELKIVLTLAFLFSPFFHALIENYQNSARKVQITQQTCEKGAGRLEKFEEV